MTSIFEGPPGSTPIEPDDQAQLIPTWIATRSDLNSVVFMASAKLVRAFGSSRPYRQGHVGEVGSRLCQLCSNLSHMSVHGNSRLVAG